MFPISVQKYFSLLLHVFSTFLRFYTQNTWIIMARPVLFLLKMTLNKKIILKCSNYLHKLMSPRNRAIYRKCDFDQRLFFFKLRYWACFYKITEKELIIDLEAKKIRNVALCNWHLVNNHKTRGAVCYSTHMAQPYFAKVVGLHAYQVWWRWDKNCRR